MFITDKVLAGMALQFDIPIYSLFDWLVRIVVGSFM